MGTVDWEEGRDGGPGCFPVGEVEGEGRDGGAFFLEGLKVGGRLGESEDSCLRFRGEEFTNLPPNPSTGKKNRNEIPQDSLFEYKSKGIISKPRRHEQSGPSFQYFVVSF